MLPYLVTMSINTSPVCVDHTIINYNTTQHIHLRRTISQTDKDLNTRSRMITRPNKKKTGGPKKVESGIFFSGKSWQRRTFAGRTRVRLARRSLVECDGGHHCESRVRPMTPRPARPAHILSACWMDFAAVVLRMSNVLKVFDST